MSADDRPESRSVAVVQAAIAGLEAQGIEWCALSGHHTWPASVPSDIDILVPPRDFGKLRALMLSLPGVRTLQEKWYEPQSRSYVSAADQPAGGELAAIDLMASHTYRSLPIMDADELLPGRARAATGLWVAAPEKEFIYYLTKRIAKSAFMPAADAMGPEQRSMLRDLYRSAPDLCRREVNRFFPKDLALLVGGACEQGDWTSLVDRLPDLLQALRRTIWRRDPVGAIVARLRNIPRYVERIVRPNGLLVVLLGPDGAGKSTVIESLPARLDALFDRTVSFHLRPRVAAGRTDAQAVVVDPYEKPPRGAVAALLQAAWWWLDYTVGYWTVVFPKLVSQSCVLFDRYHTDLQCDPARYRYGGPLWLARLLSRLLPGADLTIILDLDPAIAAARQPEMSVTDSIRQREAYRRLGEGRERHVFIDASGSREKVVEAVTMAITDCMAERIRRRSAQ